MRILNKKNTENTTLRSSEIEDFSSYVGSFLEDTRGSGGEVIS